VYIKKIFHAHLAACYSTKENNVRAAIAQIEIVKNPPLFYIQSHFFPSKDIAVVAARTLANLAR